MATDQTSHVTVRYKKCGGEITHIYCLNSKTLRKFNRKRDWLGRHLRNRAGEKLEEWLEANGAQLDCPNGPASFTRAASGRRRKSTIKKVNCTELAVRLMREETQMAR